MVRSTNVQLLMRATERFPPIWSVSVFRILIRRDGELLHGLPNSPLGESERDTRRDDAIIRGTPLLCGD